MHQGDQYSIIFAIEVNGEPMPVENIELIEFTIGKLSKQFPLEVTRNPETGEYYFPVTENETFQMKGMQSYQVRIKYANGNVVGSPVQMIDVNNSLSKNVI